MSYVKQNFVDGQTLTAAHLNHMEAGIAAAATGVKGDKGEKGEPGSQGPKGDKGDPGEGVSEIAKELLLNLFENAAYKTSDAQDTLNALRVEWGRSAQDIPVQSVSLSSSTLTLNEGESKTLTATVLPANATSHVVVWRVAPAGFATVANGVVTGIKAGSCTVTATAGGKSASCTVTVAEVETAQLLYDLPGETALTKGIDTGVKMLEHAGTETPQYTILLDAKASDSFNDKAWIVFVHCMTETGDNFNLPGININLNPNNHQYCLLRLLRRDAIGQRCTPQDPHTVRDPAGRPEVSRRQHPLHAEWLEGNQTYPYGRAGEPADRWCSGHEWRRDDPLLGRHTVPV